MSKRIACNNGEPHVHYSSKARIRCIRNTIAEPEEDLPKEETIHPQTCTC
jgi:hypothetical protein